MNAWVALAVAIVMEVAATLSLKAAGAGSILAGAVVALGYLGSFALLTVVLKSIEIGTTYAIWAGAGTALVAAIGVLALGEAINAAKVASLALIILGVIGLNLSGVR